MVAMLREAGLLGDGDRGRRLHARRQRALPAAAHARVERRGARAAARRAQRWRAAASRLPRRPPQARRPSRVEEVDRAVSSQSSRSLALLTSLSASSRATTCSAPRRRARRRRRCRAASSASSSDCDALALEREVGVDLGAHRLERGRSSASNVTPAVALRRRRARRPRSARGGRRRSASRAAPRRRRRAASSGSGTSPNGSFTRVALDVRREEVHRRRADEARRRTG